MMLKVSKGGSGNWGIMPMTAYDPNGAKQDDIRALVKFILSLKCKKSASATGQKLMAILG